MGRPVVTAAAITAVIAAAAVGITAGCSAGGQPPPPQEQPVASWTAAPGSWTHGTWRQAGPGPAADAGPAAAPYIVFPGPAQGTLRVRDVFTGTTIATMHARAGADYAAAQAAGDDRTFVLETVQGVHLGQPGYDAFYELRLAADGRPRSVALLFRVQAGGVLLTYAISQDASMLAYLTSHGGFETVSLATGRGRSWPAVDGGAAYNLSWAGDRTLAFEWTPTSLPTGPPGDTTHPPGIGIRVLDVVAPGTLVQASRPVVPYSRYCASDAGCSDDPLITPDGSKVMLAQQGGSPTVSLVEYSARTGQALATVAPAVSSPFTGPFCGPLWTDPSGEQVITYCGRAAKYDHGRVGPITLHLPMYGTDLDAFAW